MVIHGDALIETVMRQNGGHHKCAYCDSFETEISGVTGVSFSVFGGFVVFIALHLLRKYCGTDLCGCPRVRIHEGRKF